MKFYFAELRYFESADNEAQNMRDKRLAENKLKLTLQLRAKMTMLVL